MYTSEQTAALFFDRNTALQNLEILAIRPASRPGFSFEVRICQRVEFNRVLI
jgi:hypothetical protein